MDSLFVLKDASGGVVGLTYSGVSSGAPSASSNNGKIAYFSDKPDSTGGYFYARNGIWDSVGGGPVVIDTTANITANYNATTYVGCKAFATDLQRDLYAIGGSWVSEKIDASSITSGTIDAARLPAQTVPDGLSIQTGENSWLWKHTSTTQLLSGSWWLYVPVGGGYYSTFSVGKFSNSSYVIPHLGRQILGLIGSYVNHNAGTGVVKTGTFTTTSLDYAPEGTACYSTTAGDKIEFTVTGHTLVARTVCTSNGGYMVVSIDGDWTAANRLPAFTQSDYDSGLCRITDIGKRYINTGTAAALSDHHFVLSDGLADTSHVVVFETTGKKPAGSSAARSYIGGVVGCSASDVGKSLSAGSRVIAHVESAHDTNGAGSSAMLFTPEVEKSTPGTYEFISDMHGSETLETLEVYVDGVDKSAIAAGVYASGSVVQVRVVSTSASTDATSTPVFRKTMTFSASAYQKIPLSVLWKVTWLVKKRVRTSYPLMMPLGVVDATIYSHTIKNTRFDSVAFGSYISAPSDLSANDNTQHGQVQAMFAVASSSLHDVKAYAAMLDGGVGIAHFSLSAPYNVFLNDRSDGFDKIYFSRCSQQNVETFEIGDVIGGAVGFGVIKG